MVGLTFTADGKQLLCGCADGEVMAADATSGAVLWKTNPGGRNVRAIATSPDGKMLAVATEHVMWMLETGRGRMLRVMKLDTKSFGLAFSPEGKTMVTAGKDGKIYLWDNQTGKLLRPMDGAACNAVAFCPMAPPPLADAPKGQSIAVAEDKGACASSIWRTARRSSISPSRSRFGLSPTIRVASRWRPPATTASWDCGRQTPARSCAVSATCRASSSPSRSP